MAIADDDRLMREVLEQMLAALGHQVVVVADNGQSLIQQCANESPDVVITDNMMPDMCGSDAAAVIYGRRPIPIVIVSSFCDRDLVLKAEQEHVLMYLVKPISVNHLQAALARCRDQILQRASQEIEIKEQTEIRDGFGHPLSARPYQTRGALYRHT
ncbi:MAG TPA: response regulator [Pirellulales bacterium]|nr:response regulator [Pirellulales bacterium]